MERKRFLLDDEDSNIQWVASYLLSDSELDDNFDDTDIEEVILNASDFETAVRYAQQYLRKMKSEDDSWKAAEILSVVLH